MNNCLGLILAGGKSTRMGQDKATLDRLGQTMLDYSKALLMQLGIPIQVSGGNKGMGDIVPQGGPLAGIYTLLQQHQGPLPEALLVIPVDMPLLTVNTLTQLIETGHNTGKVTCYQGYYLPLYLPVNPMLLDYLSQVFATDSKLSKSVKVLIANMGGDQIPCKSPQELRNANTPEEWQQAIETLNP